MHSALPFIILSLTNVSSANVCGMKGFLEQLIESLDEIQSNRQNCGTVSAPRVGKAGPRGAPGPQGPPGIVDISAVEQRIKQMINENHEKVLRQGGLCYLGMKSGFIPDSAVTSSSFFAVTYESFQARMNNQLRVGSTGSWSAKSSRVGEWLQIDLAEAKDVAGIITQGRPTSYNQWVLSFKVSCGIEINDLSMVRENGEEKLFTGNSDRNTKVYNRFPQALRCRYIRIYPQSWHRHISMRAEVVSGACFNYTVPW